jgi:sec-independent protein translocase protein TatA
MNLGPAEILVVLVVALVVFGPRRLPEVSRQVGGALRELRRVQESVRSEISTAMADEDDAPRPRRNPTVAVGAAVDPSVDDPVLDPALDLEGPVHDVEGDADHDDGVHDGTIGAAGRARADEQDGGPSGSFS